MPSQETVLIGMQFEQINKKRSFNSDTCDSTILFGKSMALISQFINLSQFIFFSF